jgi:hypothetical protein
VALVCAVALHVPAAAEDGFTDLFTKDGVPDGWTVRAWNDLSKPGPEGAAWMVKDGVLRPVGKRGTWLVSQKTYGDFILEFEFKLDKLGNSGVALRSPLKGDPAFDGMELQLVDLRYKTDAKPDELTGAIYRSLAPKKQVYRPTEWNSCRIELRGAHLKVTLNGELIQDADLAKHDRPSLRHDKTKASGLKDRPRRGHIGFQHLSRDGSPVLIRKARIQELAGGGATAALPGWGKADLGKLPRGWKSTSNTKEGAKTAWEVRADDTAPSKSGFVLTQTGKSARPVFNICVADNPRLADVELTVSFKSLTGKDDQGGGLVWRYQDEKNYYIARYNPLEDNYRVYKIVAGRRIQMETKEELSTKPGTWHTLTVRMVGNKIECLMDGVKHLEAKDDTFKAAGQIGLWTKADAVTAFDGLQVKSLAR